MSTLRDPVGPKDRKVYIRRRILVLAALLAVIAVVVLVFVKPGSSGGAQDARQVDVPSDLATGEEDDDAEDGKPQACSAGQLEVTPATDQTQYAAGELPQLSLSVENTGNDSCTANLGTSQMLFSVASGEDQVWRSTDCQEDAEDQAVILDPGEPLETEAMAWDRTRSSEDTCDVTREPVAAAGASYHLSVSIGDVQGTGTAQFLLL